MRPRSPLRASLGRRRRALADHVTGALAGDSHAVHQARVATRRLRETLPIVGAGLDKEEVRKARRRLRRLTRLLGAVRELDVALAMTTARAAEPQHEQERGGLGRLDQALRRDLERAQGRLSRKVDPDKVERWLEKIAGLESELAGTDAAASPTAAAGGARRGAARDTRDGTREATRDAHDDAHGDTGRGGGRRGGSRDASVAWRAALTERLERRAALLRQAVLEAGVIFVPERLHEVRIALKRLRYAMELAGELGVARTAAAVRGLKDVQDTLGALHDIDMLLEYAGAAATETGLDRTARRGLDALHSALETERRTLHGQFVERRAILDRLHDRALEVAARASTGGTSLRAPRRTRVTR